MGSSKQNLIETRSVVTPQALEGTLRMLGVVPEGVLIVHSSMSRLGYVMHSVQGLLGALQRTLRAEGTLMVPTFTGEFTDPACWVDPPLPQSIWNEVRDSMPLYDEHRSLPSQMGQLPLAVLMDPRSKRSNHPLCSWAALGPAAEELTAVHDLRDPFGPRSPIAKAREMNAQVLLLGVDQRANAAILHAQSLADSFYVRRNKGPFLAEVDGERHWVQPSRLGECTQGFKKIEDELVVRGMVRCGLAGDATCRLMRLEQFAHAVEHRLRLRPEAINCDDPDCRQCAA